MLTTVVALPATSTSTSTLGLGTAIIAGVSKTLWWLIVVAVMVVVDVVVAVVVDWPAATSVYPPTCTVVVVVAVGATNVAITGVGSGERTMTITSSPLPWLPPAGLADTAGMGITPVDAMTVVVAVAVTGQIVVVRVTTTSVWYVAGQFITPGAPQRVRVWVYVEVYVGPASAVEDEEGYADEIGMGYVPAA